MPRVGQIVKGDSIEIPLKKYFDESNYAASVAGLGALVIGSAVAAMKPRIGRDMKTNLKAKVSAGALAMGTIATVYGGITAILTHDCNIKVADSIEITNIKFIYAADDMDETEGKWLLCDYDIVVK